MSTAAYTIDQTGEEAFDILRDGRRVIGIGGGGTLIYRVAEGPFLWASRTVKTLGSLQPWTCDVCGSVVDAD